LLEKENGYENKSKKAIEQPKPFTAGVTMGYGEAARLRDVPRQAARSSADARRLGAGGKDLVNELEVHDVPK